MPANAGIQVRFRSEYK